MTVLERHIGYHCGAALVGIKSANLLCFKRENYPDFDRDLNALSSVLSKRGINIRILHDNGCRVLIIIYRERALLSYLHKNENLEFLRVYGYEASNIEEMLYRLAKRFESDFFPHEVGIFLGYPLEDVQGFIRGGECLTCGAWKVYSGLEEKLKLFARYEKCSKAIMRRMANGDGLEKIFTKCV